jgi:hypothetical protein
MTGWPSARCLHASLPTGRCIEGTSAAALLPSDARDSILLPTAGLTSQRSNGYGGGAPQGQMIRKGRRHPLDVGVERGYADLRPGHISRG